MNEEEKEKEKEETPLEVDLSFLVSQLEDLVRLSLDVQEQDLKSDVSFVDVHKQLMAIKKQLDSVHHLFVDEEGRELIPRTEENIEQLRPSEKKVINRLAKLEEECIGVRDSIHKDLQEHKAEVKEVEEKLHDEKKKKAKRKGRYKKLGGKGWLKT